MDQQLRIMISIRNQMQHISQKDHTPDFADIYRSIQAYIEKHCHHHIVKDMIDIDPDRSQTIYYCEYCESVSK